MDKRSTEFIKEIRLRDEQTESIKDKALLVIEELICNCESNELLDTIYRFAHVGRGVCSNPHEDWTQELEAMFQDIIN